MESLASAVEAWWQEVPEPATGREDWDAEAKLKWTGTSTLQHYDPSLSTCQVYWVYKDWHFFQFKNVKSLFFLSRQKWSTKICKHQQNGFKEGSQWKEVVDEEEHYCLNLWKDIIWYMISRKLYILPNKSCCYDHSVWVWEVLIFWSDI